MYYDVNKIFILWNSCCCCCCGGGGGGGGPKSDHSGVDVGKSKK